MTTLNIKTLKKLIEPLPDDYEITYKKEEEATITLISDVIEIDVTNERLILK